MSDIQIESPDPEIRLIRLNRPKTLNALSYEMTSNLLRALEGIETDSKCRVVIIVGSGRGFCSGFDIKEYADPPGTDGMGKPQSWMLGQKRYWTALIPTMRSLRQPIIAAINGPAVGGGLALAVGADIRIASESANFSNGFIDIGLSGAELGLSFLLPRIIGSGRTAEFLLTGRPIQAQEAKEIGLVSRVVPDDDLLAAAQNMAYDIIRRSPFGVWMTKETLWSSNEIGSLQAAAAFEARTQVLAEFTEDHEEALNAKREKREANFMDR